MVSDSYTRDHPHVQYGREQKTYILIDMWLIFHIYLYIIRCLTSDLYFQGICAPHVYYETIICF